MENNIIIFKSKILPYKLIKQIVISNFSSYACKLFGRCLGLDEHFVERAGFLFDCGAIANLYPGQNPLHKRLDIPLAMHSHIFGVAHVAPV